MAVVANPDGAWERVRGLGPSGALLVRPDGHVGWHSGDGVAERGEVALRAALCDAVRAVMGWTGPKVDGV